MSIGIQLDANEESWPFGARVERAIPGAQPLRGHVLFTDAGWVFWRGDDKHTHASIPSALRRLP